MINESQRLLKNKDLILSTIESRGPSLPIHLAKAANTTTLFASAYLSELYREKKVLMSHMKVGSTSLYYLPGQESKLEIFIEYLNQKEKEAFYLQKKEKILVDSMLEPAIRVAIKELKDFAIPFKVDIKGEQHLFWKYFLISDEEAKSMINKLISAAKKETSREIKEPIKKEPHLEEGSVKEVIQPILKKTRAKKSALSIQSMPQSKFPQDIRVYLAAKEIEILEVKEEKNKDFIAKVRIDTLFGKQEYLLTAKNKKKISEEDILIALHKAQAEKMPALIIYSGELDKKSTEHAKEWKNLIKLEKVKF